MTIAVLIPAYNVEKYVADCLDSVLAQTYPDFEVYIMNDGSTDNTQSIIDSFAQKDQRIHSYHQENQGLTKTRNNLLSKISPHIDFIFHLDSDDFIHPKTFETLMFHMNKYQADVVECNSTPVSNTSHPQDFSGTVFDENPTVKCIDDMSIFWSNKTRIGPWINNWNKLYRWSSIQNLRFAENLAFEEDYFFQTQVNAQIKRKILLHQPLHYYRQNPTSMTKKLNLEKYLNCGINRIQLSYDTFLKTNRVPQQYLADFKADLATDAYRMIIRKNLKKNKDIKQSRLLFDQASGAIYHFKSEKIVDFSTLPLLKRLAVQTCIKRLYFLTKILVYIAG